MNNECIKINSSIELKNHKSKQLVNIMGKEAIYLGTETISTCPSHTHSIPMILCKGNRKYIKYEVHLDESGGCLIPHEVKEGEYEDFKKLLGIKLK